MKRCNQPILNIIGLIMGGFLLVSLSLLQGGCSTTAPTYTDARYNNPAWAPIHSAGVRYYYLPDIETYYDMLDNNFVYLEQGQWHFNATLPYHYNNYDLYNGYAIVLNSNVYQPWTHHQRYIANYPRYYYKSLYQNEKAADIRGYNENDRKEIYWNTADRNNINTQRNNGNNMHQPAVNRPPQNVNYPGKNIGRPVKVKANMKRSKINEGQN